MAETLLDNEVNVRTLFKTVIHANGYGYSNSESEDENENDYSDYEWVNAREKRRYYEDRIPCGASYITEYTGEIYEAFDYITENAGDVDEMDFDDCENFLREIGADLRDYCSLSDLRRAAADHFFENELWNDKTKICIYYCLDYYIGEYGDMIPEELYDEIKNNAGDADRISELDDLVDDWMNDHEGIEDFMP